MSAAPRNLLDTFVVVNPDRSAACVEVTPDVYAKLARDFDGFKGRVLVSRHDFESDWGTWEMHPGGDELVVLLSGAVEMVLDEGGTHRRVTLSTAGEFVVVPRGTWHTARTSVPASMLFVTPGEGTQNRPA